MNELVQAIKNFQEFIKFCEENLNKTKIIDEFDLQSDRLALEALQEKFERSKNEPLTLSQLRNMNGKPVYCLSHVDSDDSGYGIVRIERQNPCVIVPSVGYTKFLYFPTYGKTWVAYPYKPKINY
jgi:hypothetical protein